MVPTIKKNKKPYRYSKTPMLAASLSENLNTIRETFGQNSDVIVRKFQIAKEMNEAAIIYTDGLVDNKTVNDFILQSLLIDLRTVHTEGSVNISANLFDLIQSYVLTIGEIKQITKLEDLFMGVLSGDTVLLIDGYAQALLMNTRGWKDRGVSEAATETVIRGPRDSFSETLGTNIMLIRRRIKNKNLRVEMKQIGKVTKTDVALMYIKGIANEEIVQEVHARLDRINIDGVLETGYIEELIQDSSFSPFPTVFNTERPDVATADLLEGRVAILVDGTPFALTVPVFFAQFFQAADDYYQRADIAILLRLLRYLAFFIALLLPSLYIAITTFHQEMLPTQLLISLASQREGIPFPAFVEALVMEITFEILREAGVRMPRAIGQAVSIVGALVIGQAAVEAGIISPAMVIVVSLTAIANFVFPAFNMAISVRMLRFGLMGLAASFGLYGITVGLITLVLHLCSLRSFGVPYMSPFAPLVLEDQKDAIFRLPHWRLFSRPRFISQQNIIREETPKPGPAN